MLSDQEKAYLQLRTGVSSEEYHRAANDQKIKKASAAGVGFADHGYAGTGRHQSG